MNSPATEDDRHVECVTDLQKFESLRDEWTRLWNESTGPKLFLAYDWADAWLASKSSPPPLRVITVRDDTGQLRLLLPLYECVMRFAGILPLRALRILGDDNCGAEYADCLGDDAAGIRALNAWLAAPAIGWDLLWMRNIAPENHRINQQLAVPGAWQQTRERDFSAMRLPDSMAQYESGLSAGRRQQLRRKWRHAEAAGMSFARHTGDADVTALTDDLERLHALSWNTRGEQGAFRKRPYILPMYREYLPRAARNGTLRYYTLRTGNRVFAVQLGFVLDRRYYQLQEGFDPQAGESPGNLLRYQAIRSLIDEGVTCYDFLGGHTSHKRAWLADKALGQDLMVIRPSWRTLAFSRRAFWPGGRLLRSQTTAT